jgi:hypothetical protein
LRFLRAKSEHYSSQDKRSFFLWAAFFPMKSRDVTHLRTNPYRPPGIYKKKNALCKLGRRKFNKPIIKMAFKIGSKM